MKVKIQKVEEYPNCVKLTVSAMIDGEKVTERFGISPDKYENGDWKKIVKNWFDKIKVKRKPLKSIEGKEIEL